MFLPTDRHHEYDAIRRSQAYCLEAYSPECVEGVFSEVRAFSEVAVLLGRCHSSHPEPGGYCCTGRYGGFVTHPGRLPSPRRRNVIFPSRNCASTSPSARFAGSSPVTVLTVQATPLRATCFLVRSMRTSSARYSVTNERIRALPLYDPRPGNGAHDTSSASSAKNTATASGSLPLQASSKASAARNSSARASPWNIRSSMKRGSRFSFEAVPSEREKRERANSITRTTICLYLPPGERSPSSSSSSIFSMERSSW